MTSKLIAIYTESYWKAKEKSGYLSSLDFDASCGLRFSKDDLKHMLFKYLPFRLVDQKKFNYALLKYELNYMITSKL